MTATTSSRRAFSVRRLLERRNVSRELNEQLTGGRQYPDPDVVYAVAPSREQDDARAGERE